MFDLFSFQWPLMMLVSEALPVVGHQEWFEGGAAARHCSLHNAPSPLERHHGNQSSWAQALRLNRIPLRCLGRLWSGVPAVGVLSTLTLLGWLADAPGLGLVISESSQR